MLPKVCLLLSLAVLIRAAPSALKRDLSASHGHQINSYAPAYPSSYAPAKHSSATVTSYNRRGPQVASYAKPSQSIYGGSSYAHPSAAYSAEHDSKPYGSPYAHGPAYPVDSKPYSQPSIRSSVYSSEHGSVYAPQDNAFSEHSRHLSQDPNYDAAKDPVSLYAEHIPTLDYGSKGHTNGNELSIYGYRK
ncbi:hypothetical protein JTE90_015157 [Oedothorax gibbosus]|uniref:Cuticle protein n=1 Tax=Oedothorax gibbosus TaxID=931172 RepID=A0AAV6VS81_9ARAC|nr:hypothetical protein JTE90_015157 [Oedothorax gibbosus]